MKYRTIRAGSSFLLNAGILAVSVAFLGPYYWMLVGSLKPLAELFTTMDLIPKRVTLQAYTRLFTELPYARWYWNTLVMTAGYTFLAVALSTLAGFALAKYRFRFNNALLFGILSTQMIPIHLLIIPLFILLARMQWLNTYVGVIVPLCVEPFGVFFMRQYMIGIGDDLLEAARIDGASEYRLFWSIILPLSKPAIGAMVIYFSMRFWNNLLWPLVVLRTSDMFPLSVGLTSLINVYDPQYDLVLAGSVLSTLPLVVLFFFLQKHFMTALTITGAEK